MPPFWPDHKIFLQATIIIKRYVFCQKMGEFAVSVEHSEAKNVSASRGLRPLRPTPRPGALPLDPAGALPPDPRYRLALAMAPFAKS